MRNLRNVHRSLVESETGLQLTACAWDVTTDDIVCAFGPTNDDVSLSLKRWKNTSKCEIRDQDAESPFIAIATWDAPCPLPDLLCDEVLNLHYFPDVFTTCVVLAGGDLILVREDPNSSEEKIEIVGSVDAGISAASWSPDEELLAIVTNADTLLYMTRDFENIADVTFTPDDVQISKHVSVGWGKSETQFKGKGAKALRDPTVPETVDEGVLSDYDTRKATISWRGDGAYVAVNSIVSEKRRVIRVYSRDGNLDSVSEPVDGLTGALSWKPSGSLIASVRRLAERVDVVFFERNGLRHGEFSLRLPTESLGDWATDISLVWNLDSSVLAVCFLDRVQLWTMGNYHYYLKQEIMHLEGSALMSSTPLIWNPETPLSFVMGTTGGVQKLEYQFVTAIGPTTPPDDFGLVAVIDGKTLKVTPMRFANIPPPMALYELNLSNNALDVAIGVKDGVTLIATLHQSEVSMYQMGMTGNSLKVPELKWVVGISSNPRSSSTGRSELNQHISFDRSGKVLISKNSEEGSTVSVLDSDGEMQQLTDWPFQESKESTNSAIEMRVHDGLLKSGQNSSTPRIKFSLSSSGRLFADKRLLAQNCTSFLVTPAHLIFTTSQHLSKFVHMADVGDLEVPPDTPEVDERCRSIERGAKLVTVIPSIFALVLQMPRGNLETIYPRALVLAGIRESINAKRYKRAFLACRNQRVDLNIIHDYSPDTFILDVELFINKVQKAEYIDLFLSQLREEDVTKTMYKQTLNLDQKPPDHATSHPLPRSVENSKGKVNRICDAFLDVLKQRSSTNLQNVITAHVCKVPPDLDAGLREIARLRLENGAQAEAATEHICFLADPNRLYDNALGLYDLELALLVAQQTQKDPREYLPFLQNLEEMSVLRRQHFIDNFLGRYDKALQHLYELKAIDEVKAYSVKYKLYAQALELYRYEPEHFDVIMRLNAEYLQKNASHKEAGIAFEYVKEYNLASESYRLAHSWKESLFCARLAEQDASQIQSLARKLAEDRIEAKDFSSAANIHLDYLSDFAAAARFYCKGYDFAEAMRVVSLHNRTDLLHSVIDVGLADGMAAMTELLADCKNQLNAQVPRIHELREKKAENPLAFFEGDVAGGADIPDNVSLAPTDASTAGVSLFTRYTNHTGTVGTNVTRQTSKNKRREERKRARGKKGSVYEEEYLINSVGRLVERVNSVGDDVSKLVLGLMRRGMRERAMAVEATMVEVVKLCKNASIQIIPPSKEEQGSKQDAEEAIRRPTGGDGVLFDSIEGGQINEMPQVKDFARLSLLGG